MFYEWDHEDTHITYEKAMVHCSLAKYVRLGMETAANRWMATPEQMHGQRYLTSGWLVDNEHPSVHSLHENNVS
jgi:hypothetical protein